MREIVLATRNKDKIKEIKSILSRSKMKFLSLNNFPKCPKVIEDGKTLKENAIKKAREIAKFTGYVSLADDSGLEVEALRGRPGVYSSRFAGKNATYLDNNLKLLKLMRNKKNRKACFKCVAVLATPDGNLKAREGRINGIISNKLAGKSGFGYDPLFIIPKYKKTFAELQEFAYLNFIIHLFECTISHY